MCVRNRMSEKKKPTTKNINDIEVVTSVPRMKNDIARRILSYHFHCFSVIFQIRLIYFLKQIVSCMQLVSRSFINSPKSIMGQHWKIQCHVMMCLQKSIGAQNKMIHIDCTNMQIKLLIGIMRTQRHIGWNTHSG